jgi:hypothetical protein
MTLPAPEWRRLTKSAFQKERESAFVKEVDRGINIRMQALMDGAFSGCRF